MTTKKYEVCVMCVNLNGTFDDVIVTVAAEHEVRAVTTARRLVAAMRGEPYDPELHKVVRFGPGFGPLTPDPEN